jgi:hypothetical protein
MSSIAATIASATSETLLIADLGANLDISDFANGGKSR